MAVILQKQTNFSICEVNYRKMLNQEPQLTEIWSRLSLEFGKFKKVLRRFQGSDLDLFKKVEPHLKIEPSYKKE